MLELSANSVQAHSDSVGFKTTVNATTTYIAGTGTTCYDVEVFFGTYHGSVVSPTDADLNNTYIADVQATDTAGNTSSQILTVTIQNAIDTPGDRCVSGQRQRYGHLGGQLYRHAKRLWPFCWRPLNRPLTMLNSEELERLGSLWAHRR